MFCDQDDVWFPDKIAVTLGKMQELEGRHGGERPLLVHTDMKVADGNLRVVADSLWRYQKSDPVRGEALNRLLVQNCATGCSMMINRALCDLALPIPAEAMMHDWWLVLVAAAFGTIGHCAEPTLLYRQHGANDVGAKKWSLADLVPQLARAGGVRVFFQRAAERSATSPAPGAGFLREICHAPVAGAARDAGGLRRPGGRLVSAPEMGSREIRLFPRRASRGTS